MYKYRVVIRFFGFEPQMKCNSGVSADFWTPLLVTGYWAEPESFSFGVVNGKYPIRFFDSLMAIKRAKRINSGGLVRAA